MPLLQFDTEIPSTASHFEHLGPSWWSYLREKTLGLGLWGVYFTGGSLVLASCPDPTTTGHPVPRLL